MVGFEFKFRATPNFQNNNLELGGPGHEDSPNGSWGSLQILPSRTAPSLPLNPPDGSRGRFKYYLHGAFGQVQPPRIVEAKGFPVPLDREVEFERSTSYRRWDSQVRLCQFLG